eukprot:TRINITY_DN3592_c0_g1_i1.p1 TRINITY_DN3592_c0_g1~~TRINITY_DN3592_c0_g1_i1.p1  ORF type:complete len:306 (-),score=28.59 TRINITY_DN3592_c0_g1_i1:443-1360(-)
MGSKTQIRVEGSQFQAKLLCYILNIDQQNIRMILLFFASQYFVDFVLSNPVIFESSSANQVFEAISNLVIFESYGTNQVVRDEGGPVFTPSGQKFVTNVEPVNCARLCWSQNKCDCCNAFTYKASMKRCYLKNRAADAIDMNYTNPDGLQTYIFYPLKSGPFYDGDLPEFVIFSGSIPFQAPFQSWYSTKGEGKLAQNQGEQIMSNGSPSVKTGVTASMCATECEYNVQNCEGYSYNPYQHGGKCFFKTKIPEDSKYMTVNSVDGWRFYWKEPNAEKCYCSCKSQFICLQCYHGKCCEIDGKLTC